MVASDSGNAFSVSVLTFPSFPVDNKTDVIASSFGASTIDTMSCFPSV
ncbi:MAG TPA: hypothetical protein VEH06_10635 [Candidatus Bathyarchaeia archaeon]|nr:hypothetical protein [Candidatus Bathyarchaeia archaeon]